MIHETAASAYLVHWSGKEDPNLGDRLTFQARFSKVVGKTEFGAKDKDDYELDLIDTHFVKVNIFQGYQKPGNTLASLFINGRFGPMNTDN